MTIRPYGIAPRGGQLPDATSIGTIRLQVSNLDRSLTFYRDALGFRVLSETTHAVTLGTHGEPRPLIELHERRGARPVPRRGVLGLFHVAVLVPTRADLGRFLQHAARAGVGLGAGDHLVSEALYLQDPDNLGIEIYVDRPRETWEVANRELVMATEPVDLRDLARAGGDTPWTGFPAGTVIGHVHLSVGDLADAAAFYHAAIGFEKTAWTFPGALFMSAGGYHHHLGTNVWSAGAPPASADDARLLEWELLLPTPDDVASVASRLTAAGYAVMESGLDRVTTDPWGTALRLRSATPDAPPATRPLASPADAS